MSHWQRSFSCLSVLCCLHLLYLVRNCNIQIISIMFLLHGEDQLVWASKEMKQKWWTMKVIEFSLTSWIWFLAPIRCEIFLYVRFENLSSLSFLFSSSQSSFHPNIGVLSILFDLILCFCFKSIFVVLFHAQKMIFEDLSYIETLVLAVGHGQYLDIHSYEQVFVLTSWSFSSNHMIHIK